MALGVTASVVGIASGVNSIINSGSSAGGNVAGGGYYDPYASERPQWFNGLQTLMGNGTGTTSKVLSLDDWLKQNPKGTFAQYNTYKTNFKPTTTGGGRQAAIDMVLNSPTYMGGYQSGQRALNANLARTGQTQSGAEQLALQGYGQDYFNQQYQNLYNQYTGLSQATAAPLSMANQNQLNANQGQAGWGAVAQGMSSISQNFNNLAANASWLPTSMQNTSQPFTANWGNLDSGQTPF